MMTNIPELFKTTPAVFAAGEDFAADFLCFLLNLNAPFLCLKASCWVDVLPLYRYGQVAASHQKIM